eukprot:3852721-Rhodomonas_salina.1
MKYRGVGPSGPGLLRPSLLFLRYTVEGFGRITVVTIPMFCEGAAMMSRTLQLPALLASISAVLLVIALAGSRSNQVRGDAALPLPCCHVVKECQWAVANVFCGEQASELLS